ncbi:hypothetical protein DRJ82_12745 [Enterococcus faecalis]|nr:hypothetical protein DRJ82_12745 [Enterococcus faecalis]
MAAVSAESVKITFFLQNNPPLSKKELTILVVSLSMWKSTFKIVREANKAKFCKILYFCIVNDTRCLALFLCARLFCAVLNQFIWEATKWKRKNVK